MEESPVEWEAPLGDMKRPPGIDVLAHAGEAESFSQ